MTSKGFAAIAFLALGLFACGSGNGGDQRMDFVESCIRNLGLEKPMCKCMAEKADKNLTSNGVAFVIASMDKDIPKLQKIAGRMKQEDRSTAAFFMGRGPLECAEMLDRN